MEYKYWLPTWTNNTDFGPWSVDWWTTDELREWVNSIPDISYYYASQIIANMPSPRYKAYENNNFDETQAAVTNYI